MSDHVQWCDICNRAVVRWPGVFTVIGPRDLCGPSYWRYRRLIEEIAEYFRQANSGDHNPSSTDP